MSESVDRDALRLCVVQVDGVPQAHTEYGKLWLPVEPLAAEPDFTESLSAAGFFAAVAGPNARNILQRIQQIATNETSQLLSEILAFVDDRAADVVVLPEYLVPVQCLTLLVGFSRGRALVAGLGIIRNRDEAERLLDGAEGAWRPEDVIGRNVSVLVENERVHLVTKRFLSEREVAEAGSGPVVITVPLRGRSVRLGVAVCMDYLRGGDDLRDQAPDVVCVPAYTATVAPFLPDEPRDYVRLIANCGRHGGSTIVAPSLRGSAFTDRLGVHPVPAGCAAILMIDHDGYERRPTPLVRTENRLVLRAEIIERGTHTEVAVSAARELAELRESRGWTTSSDLPEQIGRWLEHLDSPGPLRDCLSEFRRALAQDLDDDALYAVLSTHATVTATTRQAVTRARQARFVIQRIGDLIASGMETPPLGQLLDAYRALADTIGSEAESVHQIDGQRWSFAIRLGQYDRNSAVSTLPRQLNFLRALSGLPAGSLSLTYRLQSAADPHSPDLRNFFDVIVSGDQAVVEADQVEGQLRSMLVASWPLYRSDEQVTPADTAFCLRITPDLRAHAPTVRDDWSPIFDLIRTHDTPITVDMRVSPVAAGPAGPPRGADEDEALLNTLTSMPYLAVGDETERRAAAYFNLLRDLSKEEPRALGLSLVLSSAKEIPMLLADTIRHEIFGTVPATIEQVDAAAAHAAPVAFTPSELIRIFHPPYGHIQARGVPTRFDRYLPYQGSQLPKVGTRLGSARIAGPRRDRDVDVLLDETARVRHLYLVGRTGTGKTNFLKELCRQDLESGRGLVVLDPHGDLVDYLAWHCQDRLDETVLLDFGRTDYLPVFNPLLVDITDSRSQALHVADFLRVLESRYYNEFTGPVFDDMVRQALETMFEPDFPVPRSLDLVEAMYRNREIRRLVARSIENNSVLRDRWNVFEAMTDQEKAERVVWMLSKFADLMPAGSRLRSALCSTRPSPMSIEQVVWNDGVLLVKIPESSIGSAAASFLGSLLLRRIQRAVFDYQRGTGRSPADRPAFTLYIDEFQKFATAGIEGLVAEARKFGCGLVLAHQNLEQLYAFSRFEGARSRELLNAILGNVGTLLSFRVGPQDAEVLAEVLRTPTRSFDELPKYRALCKLIVDSDDTPCFTLSVDDSSRYHGIKSAADRLYERMVGEGYWVGVEDAADDSELNLTRFEQALERGRAAVVEEARQDLARFTEKLDVAPEKFADALAGLDGPDEERRGDAMLRVLFGDLVAFHAPVPAAVRQEIVDAVMAVVDGDAAPAGLVAAVRSLLPADLDPAAGARLLDGLAGLAAVLAEDQEPTSVAQLHAAHLDLLLSGYLGSAVTADQRRDIVRDITTAGNDPAGVAAVVAGQSEPVAAALTAALRSYREALLATPWGVLVAAAEDAAADTENAPGEAVVARRDRRAVGPRDITEVAAVPAARADLGTVFFTDIADEVRLRGVVAADGTLSHLVLDAGDSALRVDLLAAPGGPLWPEVCAVVRGNLADRGVAVDQLAGPYGTELRYTEDGVGTCRLFGVDGPGWLLRGRYTGVVATRPDAAPALDRGLRGIIVKGGLAGLPRSAPILMRPPTPAQPPAPGPNGPPPTDPDPAPPGPTPTN